MVEIATPGRENDNDLAGTSALAAVMQRRGVLDLGVEVERVLGGVEFGVLENGLRYPTQLGRVRISGACRTTSTDSFRVLIAPYVFQTHGPPAVAQTEPMKEPAAGAAYSFDAVSDSPSADSCNGIRIVDREALSQALTFVHAPTTTQRGGYADRNARLENVTLHNTRHPVVGIAVRDNARRQIGKVIVVNDSYRKITQLENETCEETP